MGNIITIIIKVWKISALVWIAMVMLMTVIYTNTVNDDVKLVSTDKKSGQVEEDNH